MKQVLLCTGKLSYRDKLLSRVDRGEQSRKQCSALQDIPSKVLTGWYEKIDKNRFVLPYSLNGNHWILIYVDKPKPRGPKMQAQNTFVGFFDPFGNSLNGHLKGCFIQMITHYLDLGTCMHVLVGPLMEFGASSSERWMPLESVKRYLVIRSKSCGRVCINLMTSLA